MISQQITLPDGRFLTWYEHGPADGLPVIFCTGAGMSGSLAFGDSHLEELGIRIMAFDRPGLGASSPHLQKTLSTWTDDIQKVVKAQALVNPCVVGFSQGAPFALALAQKGIVKAAAVVSGQDEFPHERHNEFLDDGLRGMVAGAAGDRTTFFENTRGFASPAVILDFVMQGSTPVDLAVYGEKNFQQKYRACLEEGFSQGPDGYLTDLVNTFRPWPFAVETIKVPVDLWYGRLDASKVHSPDFGGTMSRRIPFAVLHQFDDEGGSILWTRSKDILLSLKEKAVGFPRRQ